MKIVTYSENKYSQLKASYPEARKYYGRYVNCLARAFKEVHCKKGKTYLQLIHEDGEIAWMERECLHCPSG